MKSSVPRQAGFPIGVVHQNQAVFRKERLGDAQALELVFIRVRAVEAVELPPVHQVGRLKHLPDGIRPGIELVDSIAQFPQLTVISPPFRFGNVLENFRTKERPILLQQFAE